MGVEGKRSLRKGRGDREGRVMMFSCYSSYFCCGCIPIVFVSVSSRTIKYERQRIFGDFYFNNRA